ncbi:uncharacterized protein J4E79_000009 [Alternaria viburni]|uniref:uncharacterized protein n=1 Tax=Alternaria viburni TaxID=566460 RepID=UPI0020C399A3|nr:uncharacterized protein J4E79_000009 [Alternaria viburni]KAI4669731.1 hypothetical protein J4E79_000009 [Alternaria viburni]
MAPSRKTSRKPRAKQPRRTVASTRSPTAPPLIRVQRKLGDKTPRTQKRYLAKVLKSIRSSMPPTPDVRRGPIPDIRARLDKLRKDNEPIYHDLAATSSGVKSKVHPDREYVMRQSNPKTLLKHLSAGRIAVGHNGCWIPKEASTPADPFGERHRYGQVSITAGGMTRRFQFNLLVLKVIGFEDLMWNKDVQASHLCGHSSCDNPLHFVCELRCFNMQRILCPGSCQSDAGDYICDHGPEGLQCFGHLNCPSTCEVGRVMQEKLYKVFDDEQRRLATERAKTARKRAEKRIAEEAEEQLKAERKEEDDRVKAAAKAALYAARDAQKQKDKPARNAQQKTNKRTKVAKKGADKVAVKNR